MSDLSTESTVAARAGGNTAWKVLAGLLALACAVLAFLLLRPTSEAEAETEGGPTATAEATGALACEMLGEVSPVSEGQAESKTTFVQQYRLGTIGALGMLAAEQDDSFEDFSKKLQGPSTAYSATFSMDSPEFHDALEQAKATCADRFPTES